MSHLEINLFRVTHRSQRVLPYRSVYGLSCPCSSFLCPDRSTSIDLSKLIWSFAISTKTDIVLHRLLETEQMFRFCAVLFSVANFRSILCQLITCCSAIVLCRWLCLFNVKRHDVVVFCYCRHCYASLCLNCVAVAIVLRHHVCNVSLLSLYCVIMSVVCHCCHYTASSCPYCVIAVIALRHHVRGVPLLSLYCVIKSELCHCCHCTASSCLCGVIVVNDMCYQFIVVILRCVVFYSSKSIVFRCYYVKCHRGLRLGRVMLLHFWYCYSLYRGLMLSSCV